MSHYIHLYRFDLFFCFASTMAPLHTAEQFRKHLYLKMAAPQTFARTFTKPDSRLY